MLQKDNAYNLGGEDVGDGQFRSSRPGGAGVPGNLLDGLGGVSLSLRSIFFSIDVLPLFPCLPPPPPLLHVHSRFFLLYLVYPPFD